MRGAVPQKGLEMSKLSINQGPYVERTDYGFVISSEHCKQLSSLLLDWKDSLPAQIRCHIDVITVNPTSRINTEAAVSIKVVLLGGGVSWETEFEQVEIYSIRGGVQISARDLTSDLQRTLQTELSKYELVARELAVMVDKLSVHY